MTGRIYEANYMLVFRYSEEDVMKVTFWEGTTLVFIVNVYRVRYVLASTGKKDEMKVRFCGRRYISTISV